MSGRAPPAPPARRPGARRLGARHLAGVALFAALVAAWQGAVTLFRIPDIIVPPPADVASALWAGFATDPANPIALYAPTLYTLMEALIGIAAGGAVGLGLAVAMHTARAFERLSLPYVMAFQALPKVALAPLLVVWFGFGIDATLVLVATSTFFPILVNALEGFKSVESDRIDLLRALGADRRQVFRIVVLPSALPFIFSGLQIALVISILSAIVGEFVSGGRQGLGTRIVLADNSFDIGQVFAVLIVLGAMAGALDVLLRLVRRKVLFWSPGERRIAL